MTDKPIYPVGSKTTFASPTNRLRWFRRKCGDAVLQQRWIVTGYIVTGANSARETEVVEEWRDVPTAYEGAE